MLGQRAGGRIIQISGAVNGDGGVARLEWPWSGEPSDGLSTPLAVDGSRLLVSTTDYAATALSSLGVWAYWLRPFSSETQFTIVDGAAASNVFSSTLYVQCQPAVYIEEGPVCAANDGRRLHLGVLGPKDASVTPLAKFDLAMTFQAAPGWITGWWNTPFAFHRASGRLVLTEESKDHSRQPYMMAASEESIGVVLWNRSNAGQTFLEIYPRAAILDH
jgi:hypothetical protein